MDIRNLNKKLLRTLEGDGTFEEIRQEISKWPHWYLRTEEELRLTKKDLNGIYDALHGGR